MPHCRIVEYQPTLRNYFEQCNREWLEELFEVEPIDAAIFKDPESYILAKGGYICFAEIDGNIVGTAALIKVEDGVYELAKMGVLKPARGKQVGEMLSRHCIAQARLMGTTKIILMSNTKLDAAMRLYEKLGFVVTSRGPHPKYNRCDICMEMAV